MGIETMMIVGTVVSGISQLAQGQAAMAAARAERDAANIEATQQSQQAQMAELEGQRQQNELKKDLEQVRARNIVAAGLAGTASPTFATMMNENEVALDDELDLIRFNTRTRASTSRIGASQSRQAGRAAMSAGRSRRIGSFIGAASTFAEGGLRLKQLSRSPTGGPKLSRGMRELIL